MLIYHNYLRTNNFFKDWKILDINNTGIYCGQLFYKINILVFIKSKGGYNEYPSYN